MAHGSGWQGGAVVACLVLTGGCFSPPEEAVARLEQTRAEAASLHGALDEVEERLLGNHAKLTLWSELAERHQQVSEIACGNFTRHTEAMAALMRAQDAKARRLEQRARRAMEAAGMLDSVGGP